MTNAITVVYPAQRKGRQFSMPRRATKTVNVVSVAVMLSLLSKRPMNGVETTPAMGNAASKK